MKILIIGGTGFIGRHLVEGLKDQYELIVLHRGNSSTGASYTSIQADRRELPSLRKTFERLKPDVVIDLIPYFAQDAWNVIHTFRQISRSVIALSSGDVYRSYEVFKNNLEALNTIPSDEEDQLRLHLFPYRGTDKNNFLLEHYDKILVEKILQCQKELDTTILRLGAVYGAFDSQRKLEEYIQPMISGQPKIAINEAKAHWKWTRVFVKDVVQAIRLAIERSKVARHQVFNVGERVALTQLELIEKLKELTQWEGQIEVVQEPSPENFNYAQHILPNTDKIRDTLNYAEQFSLEEGLAEAIAFERKER